MKRARDRFSQALRDLELARKSLESKLYEWTCFASHQAVEKALKALYQALGGEAWGHDLVRLLRGLMDRVSVDEELLYYVSKLDKHYIASRYPNSYAEGAPWEHYTEREAFECIEAAKKVVEWVKRFVEEE